MGVEGHILGCVLFAQVHRLDPEVTPELYYDNETGQWHLDDLYSDIGILQRRHAARQRLLHIVVVDATGAQYESDQLGQKSF